MDVSGEAQSNEAKIENALNTLTDALVKGDGGNPSLKETIKKLSENIDQLTKKTKEVSDKTNDKNNTEEGYNKNALNYAQAVLNERKAKFEDKGEDESDRSAKEKLKRVEDITTDKLKQVEGFIGRFIPKTVQNILGFIGGKEMLEGLNKAVTEKAQGLFAGEELKKAEAIKKLEKEINKETLEQKKIETTNSQDTDAFKKELLNKFGITAEDSLSNVSKEVLPAESVTSTNSVTPTNTVTPSQTPSITPSVTPSFTPTLPTTNETSTDSKVVENKEATKSEENAPTEIVLTKISEEAADAIANALKKVLTEKRENTGEKITTASENIEKTNRQNAREIDSLIDKILPNGSSSSGESPEGTGGSESRTSSAKPSLLTQLVKEAVHDVTIASLLKLIIKRVAAAEAVALPLAAAEEEATLGAATPLALAEVGVAAPVIGTAQALTDYFDSLYRYGYAKGGPIKNPNKPVLVGEEGPEIFVPESTGNIIPNNLLTGEEKNTTNPAAIERITSLLTQVISLPSEKLAAISNTTNIGDSSSNMLQTMNKTLLDISEKLDVKNNTNNDQQSSKLTGLMNSSNNSSSNTINIISQGNPITNSRLKMDNFLYNRRANA